MLSAFKGFIHDCGAYGTRVDHGDSHACAVQFRPQGLAEALDRRFGGAVGGLLWRAHECHHGGQVDDMSLSCLFLEMRQEKVAAVDDAPEIDADNAFPVLQAVPLEGLGEGDAGIVEQQVDLAMAGDHVIGQGRH